MRRLVLLSLVAALAFPATALALRLAPGDGTLAVRNGDGVVRMKLRGAALGKVGKGFLRVVVSPDTDCGSLRVWDADKEWEKKREDEDGEKVLWCVFKGVDMRFRFVGGDHDFRLAGQNIALSAVGRGRVYLKGDPERVRDGVYAIADEPFRSLPDKGAWFTVGAPLP